MKLAAQAASYAICMMHSQYCMDCLMRQQTINATPMNDNSNKQQLKQWLNIRRSLSPRHNLICS